MIQADSRFYVTGGTLRHDAPSYVERQADSDLCEGLHRGEFCYILTSRQMGKSSLMNRVAARLREEGVAVATLDLTGIGQNLTPEQWYDGLLLQLGRKLDLEGELEEYWLEHERLGSLQRWMAALQDVVLCHHRGRVVIFIDEIDVVQSLPFSADEFFAAVRECYTRRAEDPGYERLTFCLVGVASPTDLIRDTRLTPFNIGRRIELTDFSEAEATLLAKGLGRDEQIGKALLQRILYWTGGHPYLTQRLCQAAADDANVTSPAEVDPHCEALFLSSAARERDDNLLFVRDRLLRNDVDLASLLGLYGKVRSGQPVRSDDSNPLVDLLRLSGVVRLAGNRLAVRNRIYEQVFDREWVRQHMPDAELRRQQAAFRRGLLRASTAAGGVVLVVAELARKERQAAREARELLARAQLERGVRLLEVGDSFGLLDLLQAHETAANLPHVRDAAALVWAGWHAADESRLMRVMGHEKSVLALAISADGKLLATGSADNTARVWETASGEPSGPPLRHQGGVNAVAFSPDGKWVATASADKTARLWDARTSRPSGPPLRHGDVVWTVAFSPDGKFLATGSEDKTSRLWEMATHQAHGRPLPHPEGVHLVAFSPDGRLLATASAGRSSNRRNALRTVRLWTTADGQPHGPELEIFYPSQLVFSPDGKLLAASGGAGGVLLWKTATGESAGNTGGHQGRTNATAFSPDGSVLASAGWDGIVRLWRTADAQLYGEPGRHEGAASAVAFSPDGRLLATASADGTARLWETVSGRPCGAPMRHQGPVNQVAFSPRQARAPRLATASLDGSARLWSVPTAERSVAVGAEEEGKARGLAAAGFDRTPALQGRLHCPPLRHGGVVRTAAFSPDGKLLATGDEQHARLWETASGQPYGPPLPHPRVVEAVEFSPDGQFLATGCADGKARLWKTVSGQLHGEPLEHDGGGIVPFSPDGRLVATTSAGTLRFWEIATGCLRGRPLKHPGQVSTVAFSPDGKLFASRTQLDGSVWFWDAVTGAPRGHRVYQPGPIQALAFSPDWEWLATGADDGTARLWNATTGAPLGQPLRHQGTVIKVAFSPDSRLLATASFDGTAQVWEIVTGQQCGPPLRHRGRVTAVAFSPDGRLLATGSFETAGVWRLPAAPTNGREMALRTWVALGARRDDQGGTEAIPWQEWRALRAELRAIENRSAPGRRTDPW